MLFRPQAALNPWDDDWATWATLRPMTYSGSLLNFTAPSAPLAVPVFSDLKIPIYTLVLLKMPKLRGQMLYG